MEVVTCSDSIARETCSSTGSSAVCDSEGNLMLVWSSDGTSICLRKCINGILCDGFRIGPDDLVCEGVTVTSSMILYLGTCDPILSVGFSNGGITSFTLFGETVEMIAFCNFPVVTMKRCRVNETDLLIILHSNGLIVLVSALSFNKDPANATVRTIQLGSSEDTQLFNHIEAVQAGEQLRLLVHEGSRLISYLITSASLVFSDSSRNGDILTGIFSYARSLISPPPTGPSRRQKSSPHSIGLHRDVGEFLIEIREDSVISARLESVLLEVPPEQKFTQLLISPDSLNILSVTSEGRGFVHTTSEPHRLICSMSGVAPHASTAWTSSNSFAILNDKNFLENWQIVSGNYCEKSNQKDYGKPCVIIQCCKPIQSENPIIHSVLLRPESKSIKFDFSKLLLSQISTPVNDNLVATILSGFSRHNDRQVTEKAPIDEVALSVEILSLFLQDPEVGKNLSREKLHLVEKELLMIDLYKQVLGLYSDCKVDEFINTENSLTSMFDVITNYHKSTECVQFDLDEFSAWMKSWPIHSETNFPPIHSDQINSPLLPVPAHPLCSYREFSHNIDSALDAILSPLVLRQSDPFTIRLVEKFSENYFGMYLKPVVRSVVVQRWFFRRCRSWYSRMIGNKNLEKFFKKFSFEFENNYYFETLVLLAVIGEREIFEKFKTLAPVLLKFSRVVPSYLTGTDWRILVAVEISKNPENRKNLLEKISKFSEFSTSSSWDIDHPIPRHFGQFGIDCDIVDSIFEVYFSNAEFDFIQFSPNDDILIIQKLAVLVLLFKLERPGAVAKDVENLLRLFTELPDFDLDKFVIANEILKRVFAKKIINEWIRSVVDMNPENSKKSPPSDITALDTCISICRVLIRGSKLGDLTNSVPLMFNQISSEEIACVSRMHCLLEILRISLKCSFHCPIGRIFNFENNTPFPKIVHRDEIVRFLTSLALRSQPGSKLIFQVSSDLDVQPEVYTQIISQLLDQCFDKDIEEFVHGISSETFSAIVDRVLSERIAVCVRMLAEDNSRLHGIIHTILSREEMTRCLDTPAGIADRLVREWIHVDGPKDVLVSCTRLAKHPKITHLKIDHETIARRLIRAIDEI